MTLEQVARLYVIFKTLEPEVKEWIASDDTSVIIKAIAARFVLSDEQEQKLPLLVLRLVTQDLPPESFKAELAKETGADEGLAKDITAAIAKEVIEPIAAALRYGGINTNLLGFNTPPTSPSGPSHFAPELRGTERGTSAPSPSTPKPSQATPSPTETTKPFILHEEPRAAASTTPSTERSFSYSPTVPSRVVIERVVHYSELRTPLNVASTRRGMPSGEQSRIKMPQSKWFT